MASYFVRVFLIHNAICRLFPFVTVFLQLLRSSAPQFDVLEVGIVKLFWYQFEATD